MGVLSCGLWGTYLCGFVDYAYCIPIVSGEKKTTMGMHTIIERVVNAHPIFGDTLYFREKSSQISRNLRWFTILATVILHKVMYTILV